MAPSNKRIILTTILLAVLFIGGIIFNSLFPEGPILDPVPNPISSKKAVVGWVFDPGIVEGGVK